MRRGKVRYDDRQSKARTFFRASVLRYEDDTKIRGVEPSAFVMHPIDGDRIRQTSGSRISSDLEKY